jgi:DNA-binding response OmpR family regulator
MAPSAIVTGAVPERIAIVDDDSEFNEFLSGFLRLRGAFVASFSDGATFLRQTSVETFDVYIIDLTLPGIDGVDVVSVVRAKSPRASILVATGRVGPDAFNSCMAAGADLILFKPVRFDQVVFAMQAIARRASAFAETTTAASTDPWSLDLVTATVSTPAGGRVKVSPAEVAMLTALAAAPGTTCSRTDLARAAGMLENELRNVDAAVHRMRKRIETATGEAAPVRSVHRAGYVLSAPLTVVAAPVPRTR